MKKLLVTIISLFAIFSVVGCGKKQEILNENKSLTISENVLTVGVHFEYLPMEYIDENGNAAGFDIDMAEAIAGQLGMELNIVEATWDSIFKKLESDEFDVVISGVSHTEDRANKYLLTDSYLANGLVLVVPEDSTISDIMSVSNTSIGVQLDTTADYFIQDFKSDYNIDLAQYETIGYAFDALVKGDVAGVCTDSVIANYYVLNNPGYKLSWKDDEKEPFCICISKNNPAIYEKVNDALGQLKDNGKLKELSILYFGSDLTEE